MIYLPVNNPNADIATFENEMRTELIKLISGIPAFSNEKMTRVCGYLSNGTLPLTQLYNNICSEIKGGVQRPQVTEESRERDIPKKDIEQSPLRFFSINAPVQINFVVDAKEFIIGNKLGKIKRTNANNADAVRDNAKLSKVAGNVQWRGKSKKQFDDVMKNQVPSAAREFFNSIDAMQDEVGRALDRKRGEYDTGSQILNGLNRTLNNLAGIIRNWVN